MLCIRIPLRADAGSPSRIVGTIVFARRLVHTVFSCTRNACAVDTLCTMAVIVQKFGGTSVADLQKMLRCAKRAAETRRAGHDVVVVVSAMGHTTDELIEMAEFLNESPNPREMDMLMSTGEQVSIALMSMALHKLGVDAVSMTGIQMGMRTDGAHTKAKIQGIDIERFDREFRRGRVIVAAGFQGVSDDGQITTLGRGGSDTTAVAIAAALGSRADSAAARLLGDGLVPLDSALGRHPTADRCLAFDDSNSWVGYGMNHADLLGQAEVYWRMADWLA